MTDNRSRAAARVGLLTCAALPLGDADDEHLTKALTRAGIDATWIEWNSTDPRALADEIDLLLVRSPWDYPDHHGEFLAWLDAVPVPVHNGADVIRWNSHKGYLLDLAAAAVPVVPTQLVTSKDDAWFVPEGFEEFVVKPSIGVGSMGARRFTCADLDPARGHVADLIAAGRPVMVQPYLPSVDAGSETALIHFDGTFSHSISKGPMLTHDGQRPLVDGLYVLENIDARQAREDQRSVALRALAAVPGGLPLYARVDLIDAPDGSPVVLELELIEPSLFFAFDPTAADRLAGAVASRL